MKWWDYLRKVFSPYGDVRALPGEDLTLYENVSVRQVAPVQDSSPSKRATTTAAPLPSELVPLPAGRVSVDNTENRSNARNLTVLPPTDHESFWRLNDLDTSNIGTYTPQQLLDMLIDISPEISKASWDFQRLCNPGFEVKAYELNEEKTESEVGKQHIDGVFAMLRDLYGSADVVIGRFFMGAWLRGGFCGELVLDGGSRETVDLVAPDPYSIRFRSFKDPLRGDIWQAGQVLGNNFIPLDIPTFRYIPVDPAPASPYGRSLAAPALFTTLFILGLMHDVKRVIMQQGYKRMDIEINTEASQDAFSFDQQGYTNWGEYISAAIAQVKLSYSRLQPDDAWIHTDLFKLNTPAGTVDSDSIGAIDQIIARLEKMVTRALKSNSLIMDTENSTSETDSNRRWEIHAAGIKSLQHNCEAMLESLLNVSLRAKGIPAKVEFRFAELRAAEMFRDEQTRALRIQNSRNEFAAGFSSQDEVANKAVNHNADVPEPREPLKGIEQDVLQDNNDGNEALDKNQDERGIAIAPKPAKVGAIPVQLNGVH